MSKAEPMDPVRRALLYTERTVMTIADGLDVKGYADMTPAQRRRWTRKAHRFDGLPWPVTGKGRPTPRRPRRA